MKRNLMFLFTALVLFSLMIAPAGTTGAQGPLPPPPPTPEPPFPPGGKGGPTWDPETGKPLLGPLGGISASQVETASIPLGQPGLSFRYVQTFGVTEEPYLEDNDHFYGVEGLGVDGNNIWVTDSWSDRVLKFDANGNFQQKIGKAGVIDYTGTSLDYITDVAVDNSGNIWVVDGGAAHVVKYNASGQRVSELGDAWDQGSDNSHFNNPIGIAFDSAGNIYVSDTGLWGDDYGNHRVQVFDSDGNYLTTIGQTGVCGSGNNQFCGPRHIAIYGNRLYVADSANHRVQIFDITTPSAPVYVATLGVTGQASSDNSHFNHPEGVGVDTTYIYVADSNNDRVQIFNRITLAYVATLGTGWGQGDYQFNHPTDVVVDSSGNIYVADNYNRRVQQFSSSRVYQRTYGTTGVSYVTDGYHYYYPLGVAVAQDGSIYIVEERGHRLVKLNAAGVPQWTIGEPGQVGSDNSHFFGPQDVAVDGIGRVYTVESWDNNRVQIFNPDGTHYATLGGWGTGNYQFKRPSGITIDHVGNIYVADTGNHRVQIYNSQFAYVATLGVTGVSGSDNAHFNYPNDVAVDANGTIYVADEGNDRVQVFNSSRQYVRTIGGGGTGSDFGHFDGWGPHRLAVDSQNRLYVTDSGNTRVQVFDSTGAYLTTIGGSNGKRTSQFRHVIGVAVGPDNSVYTAEAYNNHRIQKFAPGVPGWVQSNINGFGERQNGWISSLLPFQGMLYATGYQSYVWRMAPDGAWTPVSEKGFGDATNVEIDALAEFNGSLYAATFTWVCDDPDCNTGHTNGPQIWHTADGTTWNNVTPAGGIGSGDRYVASFVVFDGQLYASLGSFDVTHGAEIWRTADGLTWERVVENGFANDVYNTTTLSFAVYNGNLYAGTRHGDWYDDSHTNGPLGGEVWRSSDGTIWTRVNDPGFGTLEAHRVERLIVFQDGLYAYISHVVGTDYGADVWRCTKTVCSEQSDWSKVVNNGFSLPENQYLFAGAVFNGYLYAEVQNTTTGVQLWRTPNGSEWEKATPYDGFGDSNNYYVYNNAMTVFNNCLYIGTMNWANGGEVWQMLNQIYLPLIMR